MWTARVGLAKAMERVVAERVVAAARAAVARAAGSVVEMVARAEATEEAAMAAGLEELEERVVDWVAVGLVGATMEAVVVPEAATVEGATEAARAALEELEVGAVEARGAEATAEATAAMVAAAAADLRAAAVGVVEDWAEAVVVATAAAGLAKAERVAVGRTVATVAEACWVGMVEVEVAMEAREVTVEEMVMAAARAAETVTVVGEVFRSAGRRSRPEAQMRLPETLLVQRL